MKHHVLASPSLLILVAVMVKMQQLGGRIGRKIDSDDGNVDGRPAVYSRCVAPVAWR